MNLYTHGCNSEDFNSDKSAEIIFKIFIINFVKIHINFPP
jgi:hypothetical protein